MAVGSEQEPELAGDTEAGAATVSVVTRDESLHYPGVELVLHYKQFLNFDLLLQFIIFFVFLIFVITFSILLRQWKLLRRMTEIVPESVTLLVVGSLLGFIGHLISQHVYQYIPRLHTFEIDHLTVYSILIPPIILHASYDLYHPQFFRQISSILTLAILGTMLNAALIAVGLYFLYAKFFNPDMNIFHIISFSSLIAAVDPVAVIAVFEEVDADKALYFLVFGEALLNDGVTFVLFEGFKELAVVPGGHTIPTSSFLFVLTSFLTAPVGGLACGTVCGLISAFLTRYTPSSAAHLEPVILASLAMLAYVVSAKLGWSAILALIAAGLLQRRYAFPNLAAESAVTARSLVRSVAVTSEVVVFVLLGNGITQSSGWDWTFIGLTLALCYAARAVSVLLLSTAINFYRYQKISLGWQSVIWLGGLRGAIAYTMAISYSGPFREIFIGTTLVVIFVTVAGNGVAAGPTVRALGLGAAGLPGEDPGEMRWLGWEERWLVPGLVRTKQLADSLPAPPRPPPRPLATMQERQGWSFGVTPPPSHTLDTHF